MMKKFLPVLMLIFSASVFAGGKDVAKFLNDLQGIANSMQNPQQTFAQPAPQPITAPQQAAPAAKPQQVAQVKPPAAQATPKKSRDYTEGYECAMEGLEDGSITLYPGIGAEGASGYCVGNSRDPSKDEERGWGDAIRDFQAKKTGTSAGACPFGYATWEASGSHADGFKEGLQKETSLKMIGNLAPGRDMRFYDPNGKLLPNDVANSLFVKKGDRFVPSDEAKRICPKKL